MMQPCTVRLMLVPGGCTPGLGPLLGLRPGVCRRSALYRRSHEPRLATLTSYLTPAASSRQGGGFSM